jgi:Putative polyhydroxyalkanoic acid system protein (PHA_gran_rgn)
MSLINLTVKHGQSVDEAKRRLERFVQESQSRFGSMVQRMEWNADRDQVKLYGTGFEADVRVDSVAVHVAADIPALAGFLQGPIVSQLRGMLEQTFQKQLPKS